MTTQRQIDANRLNALKSTGPTTVEGKSVSRLNATTHGLAAELGYVEFKINQTSEERRNAWAAQLKPVGELANATLDRMVAASLRVDQCDDALDAVIIRHAARATAAWDVDHRLEAAEVASGLAKDPTVVAIRLESTTHGCAIMIKYWERLNEAAESNRPWTDAESSLALDLLAVARSLRNGTTPIDPKSSADIFEHRRTLAVRELDRLGKLKAELEPVDLIDRRHAEAGKVAILTAPAQLLMRYHRDAYRRLMAALRELQKAAKAAVVEEPKRVAAPPPPPPKKSDDLLMRELAKQVREASPSLQRPVAPTAAIPDFTFMDISITKPRPAKS